MISRSETQCIWKSQSFPCSCGQGWRRTSVLFRRRPNKNGSGRAVVPPSVAILCNCSMKTRIPVKLRPRDLEVVDVSYPFMIAMLFCFSHGQLERRSCQECEAKFARLMAKYPEGFRAPEVLAKGLDLAVVYLPPGRKKTSKTSTATQWCGETRYNLGLLSIVL